MQNRIESYQGGIDLTKMGASSKKQSPSVSASPTSQMTRLTDSIEQTISQHPAVSLGVGLAVGAFVGWLLKRK